MRLMSGARLHVKIPIKLHNRLVYLSRLPAHQAEGGTLESLVTRILEDGSVGIALHYERFESARPFTTNLKRQIRMRPKKRRTR